MVMKITLLFVLILSMPLISSAQEDSNEITSKAKIIAIPATEKSIDALMDQSFSRCSFFCLYNTKTKSIVFEENKHKYASGGASRLTAQFLSEHKVNEVYAVEVGQNAKIHLDKLKINTIIVGSGKTIKQLITNINDN